MQLGLPLDPPTARKPAFESPDAFGAALETWLASSKGSTSEIRAAPIETPLGTMVCAASPYQVFLLEFADRPELPREMTELAGLHGKITPGRTDMTVQLENQLTAYFAGDLTQFDLPMAFTGSGFAQDVWTRLTQIPFGTTTTYGTLANDMGRPTATRAVARANGANRMAIIVPCHRVIGADGSLTGYAGGLWRKEALVALEMRVAAGT